MKIQTYCVALLLLATGLDAGAAQAQDRTRRSATVTAGADTSLTGRVRAQRGQEADVMLEIPRLVVDSIGLKVQQVDAHLSLDAQVANLVSLRAGADVHIGEVDLTIAGVEAEAYLYVYLDDVVTIVNRTLETLERNPQIIETLGQTLQQTVGTVGDVAGRALGPGGAVSNLTNALGNTLQDLARPGGVLSQTVNTVGQTVTQTLSQTGRITESIFNQAGQLVNQQTLGTVTDLTNVVNETTNQLGQTVRRVRDQAGNVIEYTLDQAGKVTNARVVEKATGR